MQGIAFKVNSGFLEEMVEPEVTEMDLLSDPAKLLSYKSKPSEISKMEKILKPSLATRKFFSFSSDSSDTGVDSEEKVISVDFSDEDELTSITPQEEISPDLELLSDCSETQRGDNKQRENRREGEVITMKPKQKGVKIYNTRQGGATKNGKKGFKLAIQAKLEKRKSNLGKNSMK